MRRPRRDDRLGERHLRPARPRRRPRRRTADGLQAGDHDPPRRHPGGGNRRPAARGHAARAGRRLRDVRRRRRAPPGDRGRQGRVPERKDGRARCGPERTRDLRRDRLRGDRHPQGRDHRGDRIRQYTDFGCPAAGKTGTTEGLSDAWFVGYTPRLSTAVWVGHPTSRASTGFGGPTAGPIWHSYMEAAHGSYCDDFPPPQNPVQFSNWSGSHTVSAPSTHTFGGTGTSKPAPSSGAEQRQVPAQPVRAGRRPGARSEPRGQRRRRRAASGQLRRRRTAAARARPSVRHDRRFGGAIRPLTRPSGRGLRSVAYLHACFRTARRSDTASLRRSR